jgi:uncharacterized membrane protein YbhN (UPF0104 family)
MTAGRWWRLALVACGAALFAYLLAEIGPAAVADSFAVLSWRLLIVLVFPCLLIKLFDTLAWYWTFPTVRVPFWPLARIRLAGQAVNATTPTGTLGGDAVKIWMLRDRLAPGDTLVSLVVAKTTMVASQGLLLALGLLIVRRLPGVDRPLVRGMEALLGLEVLAVGGFVAVQLAGVLGRGHRVLRRFGIGMGSGVADAARAADHALATLYRERPGLVALSLAYSLAGWFASAAETWLILSFLGAPVTAASALAIEAFSTAVRFLTFFVPAQIGAAEAGSVAACVALGLRADVGLSLSLVRRVREAAWTGVGLLLLAGSPRPSPALVHTTEA